MIEKGRHEKNYVKSRNVQFSALYELTICIMSSMFKGPGIC